MANRKLWWYSGFLAVALLVCGTTLGVMLKHEPNFYEHSRVEPSQDRHDDALRLSSGFGQMCKNIDSHRENWHFDATESQLDSFLADIFPQMEQAEKLRKLGITDPIIALDDDCIRVAFRFGTGWFSTVISYDLQVWLVPKEANAVAVKVLRARAGAVPISSQTILHRLAELAHEQNIDMNLYRHDGKSVAILKLGDPFNPTWILTALKVGKTEQGRMLLALRGRTPDHILPPPMIGPDQAGLAP
jgi:hypothetical protein